MIRPDLEAAAYRQAVAAALAAGGKVADMHAARRGDEVVVRAVLAAPDGTLRIEEAHASAGAAPSIVDLVPAVGWDEREAHDRFGLRFAGHEPLRPLVDHDPDLARWTTEVTGEDVHQVAVGPIHAGVIESGHFRFHLVGERILHLDARLFYKHRGLEEAAEGETLDAGLAYVVRACGACAVTNAVAYAQACESLRGLIAPPAIARARTVLLELERVWSHLNDVAAICAGAGFAAGSQRFAALTEEARRLNGALTGHRFLRGAVAVGKSPFSVTASEAGDLREQLAAIAHTARRSWRELIYNGSFMARLPDIGVLGREDAMALGATGPAARASGLQDDVRSTSPLLAYEEFAPVLAEAATGDVAARFEQRSLELWQSLAILDRLLEEGAITPAETEPGGEETTLAAARVESPRGATVCVVERHHDRIARLRLRTGSYANWPVVAHVAAGNLVPDFPLINKSFELCYACADR